MHQYPIIPGRGLTDEAATLMRHDYLQQQGHTIEAIRDHTVKPHQLTGNIESFIGSVEIPLGLAGPLLFRENEREEMVYAAAATLEGALVASMNRGAKAVSLSGGFTAEVLHQKMTRAPMFIFSSLGECRIFTGWVSRHFTSIKAVAEQYSNHAVLLEILPFITGKSAHLKFVYRTGDAAGQNMTTTCTWHAILWIKMQFEQEHGFPIGHFVIEGNGSSDKKFSQFSVSHGRGMHVVAECHLQEDIIRQVLRCSSADITRCYNHSVAMSRLDGMAGYNINVANAIAALFAATGQDLACLHESSCGILNIEHTKEGLYLSLNLPALVIGTVGGGTHLPAQKEALELMGCCGTGKVERFAKLIAGFALALEISTYAAIVSGQFAKAHEKLGRNKPVNWLLRSEVDIDLLKMSLNGSFLNRELHEVNFPENTLLQNGIITTLTSKVNRKLTGLLPLHLKYSEKGSKPGMQETRILLKSKALDTEVIKGLHIMAAAIDPELADLISKYQGHLEYRNCHKKEILIYEYLHTNNDRFIPAYHGKMIDEKREIYLLLQELLPQRDMKLINTENEPEKWTGADITACMIAAAELQGFLSERLEHESAIPAFEPWKATELYLKFIDIAQNEYRQQDWAERWEMLQSFCHTMEAEKASLRMPLSIIHNDLNSRNIAIQADGTPCIYDWELAVRNVPQRDIAEFLSFVLPGDITAEVFHQYYHEYRDILRKQYPGINAHDLKAAFQYALKEYMLTRVSFYLAGNILMDHAFAPRVFNTAFRMLQLLETGNIAV